MKRPQRRATLRPGLSLLEVMVALAIFIMSLAALGQLVQLGMEQADEADKQTVATRLAQSKLAEFEAGAIDVTSGGGDDFTEQETTPDGTAVWAWTATSEPSDVPNVYTVTVTVSSKFGRPFSTSLTQVIFDPAFIGTGAPATDPNATTTAGNKP